MSNLDAKLRLEMRAEIRRIHNELGATTIYVTHDQDEALSMADRIVVLRDGAIRQVGSPQEVYDRPADIHVAEFMGFRNRVPGVRLAPTAGRERLEVGGVILEGTAQGPAAAGAPSVALFRPEDVTLGPPGGPGLPARVRIAIEYRGREFVGTAPHGLRDRPGLSVWRNAPPGRCGYAHAGCRARAPVSRGLGGGHDSPSASHRL